MPMPPTFILSLDCEGKWGLADMLRPRHHRQLTNSNLVGAYRLLLDMFARYEIPATFAFVMALTLSNEEKERFPVLDRRQNPGDPWLEHYWRCLEDGLSQGWHVPETLELVRDAGVHEIASHSFCHRPLGNGSIDPKGAAEELAHADAAAALKGLKLRTLVFPRNEVGNLRTVRSAGYLGFRSRLAPPRGKAGRFAALLNEFVVKPSPQQPDDLVEDLVAIPSGRFFNWRFGLRRLVPPAVTRARWHNQLEQCSLNGGVVHLWLHPHNLITGPGTARVLADVLEDVARFRDRGLVQVMTQRDYCEQSLGGSRPADRSPASASPP